MLAVCALVLCVQAAWGQAKVEKAVYYDPNQTQGWMGVDARELIHDYFVNLGYADLDSEGVKKWMDDRIKDHVPSVIVMSQDIYPSTIVEVQDGQIADITTLRRYLDAGGKVVHLADWPIYYVSVEGANINPAGGGATKVLGFGASDINDANEEVTITADGAKWGLTQTWTSQRALDPAKADVVLASIQGGAGAAGWVRRFALLPGSGYVRLWDTSANSGNITEDVLADIQRVAEYGLDAVVGMGTVKGVVVDQNGKPVPGATVKLTASFGSATAITNDAGEFSIVAAAGSVKATASAKVITSSETVDVTVKTGETAEITIKVSAVEPYVYHIVKAKAPIVIDGNITGDEWADAETMVLDKQAQVSAGTWDGPDDLSGVWRVKFDDQYLYIAVDITDDQPRINAYTDGNVWQGDGIETYVGLDAYDPKRTAYNESRNYQWTIGVGPDIAWKIFRPTAGDRLPPDIPDTEGNLVVKDHPAGQKPGYVIEARMPWSGFPDVDTSLIPPKEGSPAAITAGINDTDTPDSTSRETAMLFEKTTEAWHDPSVWVRAMWGAPAKPVVVKGDVNGDGKLGIPDATIALRIAVGLQTATAEQLAAGDINGNGKIDIPDVTRILRTAVGLDTL